MHAQTSALFNTASAVDFESLDASHLNEAALILFVCERVNVWVKSTVSSMSKQPRLPPGTHPPISRAVES